MTKQEIEEYFQKELYEEAAKKLRNALQEDSSNAEWFYYLYLAENKDYANIDFDNVHNEMDLNRAMELSNKRLRDFFDSEYSFYKAVDPYLRKFFTYASRENYKSFSSCLDSYSFKPTKLIHNYTDKNDFFSNLDYLVTIRIKPEIVYLNLLALNILYIVTKEEDVLSVWNTLKEKAKDANMESSELKLFHTKEEIKESLHSYLNKKDNNKNKVVIEERKPEPKKEEAEGEVEESLREDIFDESKSAAVKHAYTSIDARLAKGFEGFYVETKYENADPEYRNYASYMKARAAAVASSCLGNATQAKVFAKSKVNGHTTLIDGYVKGNQAGKGKTAFERALKAADGTAAIKNTAEHQAATLDLDNDNAPAFQAATAQESATDTAKPADPAKSQSLWKL